MKCFICNAAMETKQNICPKCGFVIYDGDFTDENLIENSPQSNILKKNYRMLNTDPGKPHAHRKYGVNIGGKEVFITKEEEGSVKNRIIKGAKPNRYKSAASSISHYISSANSLEELLNNTNRMWEESTLSLTKSIQDITSFFITESPTSLRDLTLGALFSYGFTPQFQTVIEEISQATDNVTQNFELSKNYRDMRKASRGRFGFIASSPSGIVKGAVKAGALNAATGLAHSVFNMIGNSMSRSEMQKNKAKILTQIKKDKVIQTALSSDLRIIEEYILQSVKEIAYENDYESIVDEWCDKADAYLQLYPYLDNQDEQENCLLLGLSYNPREIAFYYYLLKNHTYFYTQNQSKISDFAQKQGIDTESILKYISDALEYKNKLYITMEECRDAKLEDEDKIMRTFQGVLYDTIEDRYAAEDKYIESCTYNNNVYDSPDEAEYAKKYDHENSVIEDILHSIDQNDKDAVLEGIKKITKTEEENEFTCGIGNTIIEKLKNRITILEVDEVLARVDYNSRDSLIEAIQSLQKINTDNEYCHRKIKMLEDKHYDIGYEKVMKSFKQELKSSPVLTEKITNRCSTLLDEAQRKASKEELDDINKIVTNLVNPRANTIYNDYQKNKNQYDSISERCLKEVEDKPYPFFASIPLDTFILSVLLCTIPAAIICLVHFFQTLGTGYTFADAMFWVYGFFACVAISFFREEGFYTNDDCEKDFLDKHLCCCTKAKVISLEKEQDELSEKYNYCLKLLEKVNKKKEPIVLSEKLTDNANYTDTVNLFEKQAKAYDILCRVVYFALGIVLMGLVLWLVFIFSPAWKQPEKKKPEPTTKQSKKSNNKTYQLLDSDTYELKKGCTLQLYVKKKKGKVKWSTSNKKVATVSKKGLVKAKKKGTALITAKHKKEKYVYKVKVVTVIA